MYLLAGIGGNRVNGRTPGYIPSLETAQELFDSDCVPWFDKVDSSKQLSAGRRGGQKAYETRNPSGERLHVQEERKSGAARWWGNIVKLKLTKR